MESQGVDAIRPMLRVSHRGVLLLVLAAAAAIHCRQLRQPLVDGMSVKQVFNANKARHIAGPPLSLACNNTYDWLDENGRPAVLSEEFPLYASGVGVLYHWIGEWEGLGRLWGIIATLVAIAAWYDLVSREFDKSLGIAAAILLTVSPLLMVYGHTFQPDSSMLACMLVSASCYSRWLERRQLMWLLAAIAVASLGALFKYYGLMVLFPLAWMAYRRNGWRAWLAVDFVVLNLLILLPVLLWTTLVFLQTPNPAAKTPYFIFQMPGLLLHRSLYERFVDRLLWKDCGPIASILIGTGLWSVVSNPRHHQPIVAWTLMALTFYVLLGPMICTHNYYELMMLPAASLWAALGWKALANVYARRISPRWSACGALILLGTAVVQSPWVIEGKGGFEKGYVRLGERLNQLCTDSGRFIVAAPNGFEIVHYSRRQGWIVGDAPPRPRWKQMLARYRGLGAEYVAVYLNAAVDRQTRSAYLTLLEGLTVVDHEVGPWSALGDRSCEFYIASARPPALEAFETAQRSFPGG
jgi:hypothetical protein